MIRSLISFDAFILPRIAKVVYWIGLILIGVGTAISIVRAVITLTDPYGGAGQGTLLLVLALLGGSVFAILWRLMVELWLVLFSIYDVLRQIRDGQTGLGSSGTSSPIGRG